MARKNTLEFPVLTGQSLAGDFTSPVTDVRNLDNCSYQIVVVTSDDAGTFSVEASNDYERAITGDVTDPGTWAALPLGGIPTIASAADIILINLNQLPFKAIRVTYTSTTAGTGTCDIKLVAKQIGG
jgi:hypothetical protein